MMKNLISGYPAETSVHPICFLLRLKEGQHGDEENFKMEGKMPFIPFAGMEFTHPPFTSSVEEALIVYSVTWNGRDNCFDVWFENRHVTCIDDDDARGWFEEQGWEGTTVSGRH
jgi:hypothetical protein